MKGGRGEGGRVVKLGWHEWPFHATIVCLFICSLAREIVFIFLNSYFAANWFVKNFFKNFFPFFVVECSGLVPAPKRERQFNL